MTEHTNEPQLKTRTAQTIDQNSSLLPMLIAGLILISIGYAGIMIFV